MNGNETAPEDLMKTVEQRLANHIKNKARKKRILISLSAVILLFSFVFNQPILGFASRILKVGSPGVQLALNHNKATKINKTFTVGDITLKFNELIADGTGTAITFEFNQDNIRIDRLELSSTASGYSAEFGEKEGIIYFPVLDEGITNLEITALTKSINEKQEETIDVDWELPLNIVHQETKVGKINKIIKFEEGEILLKDIKLGVKASEITFDFKPKGDFHLGKFIQGGPGFFIYSKEKFFRSHSSIHQDNITGAFNGTITLDPLIYDDIKKLNLILISFGKTTPINKEINLDPTNLPITFDILGTKAVVKQIKQLKDKTKICVELERDNRLFQFVDLNLKAPEKQEDEWGASGKGEGGKISRPNDKQREAAYRETLRIIPTKFHKDYKDRWPKQFYNQGLVSHEIETEGATFEKLTLVVEEATEFMLYHEKVQIRLP